jgi:hypothetical protein
MQEGRRGVWTKGKGSLRVELTERLGAMSCERRLPKKKTAAIAGVWEMGRPKSSLSMGRTKNSAQNACTAVLLYCLAKT